MSGMERKVKPKISKERAGPVDREHTANVMKTLHSLRAQGIATDITVQCKDGEFKAHSVVLLASGLADRVKESRDKNLLDLSELPASGVAVLLDYVYLGRARLSLENGLSALEVSRRLNMRDLFDKCRKFICPFMLDPSKITMAGLPSELTDKRIEVKIDQKIDKTKLYGMPANDKFKKEVVKLSDSLVKNPVTSPLPANMQSAVKRVLPHKSARVSSSSETNGGASPENGKLDQDDKDDKSDLESVASTYTTGSETVTPSSSDNDETESQMTGNDSDNSAGTTSSLGSLANRKPRRQKSVKWV